jgi:tetratricopeptide (TPR) repeat protein
MKIKYLFFLALCFSLIINSSCNYLNKKSASTVIDSIALLYPDLVAITKAIDQSPAVPSNYYERALFLFKKGNLDLAAKDMYNAIKLDSSQANYYEFFGDINQQALYMKLALNNYQKAKLLSATNIDLDYKIAKCQLYLKQYKEAQLSADGILKNDDSYSKAYLLQGIIAKEMGDTSRAIKLFRFATDRNPDYFDAYMQLGLLCQQKNMPIAQQYFENALRIDSNSYEANYAMAMYYHSIKKYENAIIKYERLIKEDAFNWQPAFNLGTVFYDMGKMKQAMFQFDLTVQLAPKNATALYYRGLCYEWNKNWANAQQDFKAALALNPQLTAADEGNKRVLKIVALQ